MKIFVETESIDDFMHIMKTHHIRLKKIGIVNNGKYTTFEMQTKTTVGRPRILPVEKITELRNMGKSISLIAKELNLPRSSVYSITKDIDIKQVDTLPNTKEELSSLIQVLKYQIDHAKTISERENFEEMRNNAIKKREALLNSNAVQ